MAKKNETWFKVYRSLTESELWLSEPFTKGQAWVDLIGLANIADKDHIFKASVQTIKRGEIKASLPFFEDRWHWSRNRVKRYFKLLTDLQMVSVKYTTIGTAVTIENYNKYQGRGVTNEPTDEPTNEPLSEPSSEPQNKNNKRIYKERADAESSLKSAASAPPPEFKEFTDPETDQIWIVNMQTNEMRPKQ